MDVPHSAVTGDVGVPVCHKAPKEGRMKFSVKAQSVAEFIGAKFNLVPLPVVHTSLYAHVARTVCEAVALDIFESIGHDKRTSEEIAAATGLNQRALETVLNLLVSIGYLHYLKGTFRSSRVVTKWLLKDSDTSIRDAVLMFRGMWKLYDHLPTYLRTGEGLDLHSTVCEDEWKIYQRAMFQLARMGVKEIAKKTPIPKGATSMLDIGGSHGLYSVECCKRVPSMSAVVLDLPLAIAAAAPILAAINADGRVRHQPGNILEDDIGENRYDLILMSSLAHHFLPEQNQLVAGKAARALKPGGYFIIQDFIRPPIRDDSDTACSIQNLFFGLTSSGGVYAIEEEQAWCRQAGLRPVKVNRFLSAPIDVQVIAQK